MLIRTKLQPRAIENINTLKDEMYPRDNVTKGHIVSELLEKSDFITADKYLLSEAIHESDIKNEGGGIPVNLTITAEANNELQKLKHQLDKATGRSFFPAQVIDIVAIMAVSTLSEKKNTNVSDEKLAKALLDIAYMLLTNHQGINLRNAKYEMIDALKRNNMI